MEGEYEVMDFPVYLLLLLITLLLNLCYLRNVNSS